MRKCLLASIFALSCGISFADDVAPCFEWTPGANPTGSWFTSWTGETYASGIDPLGDEFTFVTCGSADDVTAASGKLAVLWCMGRKTTKNETGWTEADGEKTMLVKDSEGNILVAQISAMDQSTLKTVSAGPVKGTHLFTVRFDKESGVSLQIDNGPPCANANMTTPPGKGFQVRNMYGGAADSFVTAPGFEVVKMLAYKTAELPAEQYAALCDEYPCAKCTVSSTCEAAEWIFPQDATPVPGSFLGALEFGKYALRQTFPFDRTNAVAASVLAALPAGASGALVGIVDVRDASEHGIYANANGDGTFTIRFDNGSVTGSSVSSGVIDASALHVWTLAYDAASGAKLYCDGELVAHDAGIKWTGSNNQFLPAKGVAFGCDYHGNRPLQGMKIYAAKTDFGAGSAIFDVAAGEAERLLAGYGIQGDFDGEPISSRLAALALYDEFGYTSQEVAGECVLRISEVMPKPTDARTLNGMEGMDVNGLESGWVEVENVSDSWADLADYRFIRVNRGKKTDPFGNGNFPHRLVPPHSRAIFYTSERYSNSSDQTVSAFEHGTFDGRPMIFKDYGNILVWGDKVNPKKSPYVRLYYAPGGDKDAGTVVDTVVVPSDLPEGWSIIVGDAADGEGTRRWMCPTPTRGAANVSTAGLTRIGPNVGPLYEKKGQKKTDYANEFAVNTPPAIPGEDYAITLPVNPVMNPDGSFTPRDADKIVSMKLVYRKGLDDSTLVTNAIDMATKTTVENWGDQYAAAIPASYFPERGDLMQWKVLITDAEGVEWTSPSFNNPDDGYEWYGTIVEPSASQMSATLPTWHMFAKGDHLTEMDKDKDDQDKTKVPNNARIAIYDSSTSNYYDYVRIDLRGHTSAKFTKKGHGLRFAKAHPLTMTDVVTGETIEEIRKTSIISEYADPSYMRQMVAFWLFRKMGNLVPFDFPVRCNLNGEFYELAFNSERFSDELIEDVYGLDKFGYGYKNVGTLKSGSSTTAGGIEKKTPDDEDESNITVLQNEFRSKITAADDVKGTTAAALSDTATDPAGLDNAELTKFVVRKFDLPAWLNYLASARITQEMDDAWANVCIYYDNPDMKEGSRGQGTWMPLGYDFNLSLGQWYYNDVNTGAVSRFGLMAEQDWFKSHPFYGGNRVRCWKAPAMGANVNSGNNGFEAVWQSAKFRRLYLRRLRTLMDQELKEPGTAEADTPFMAKMRELADLMRDDAALDKQRWPADNSDNAIQVWTDANRPKTMDAGIQDIWDNYVVPRRRHLYGTHSVTNTAKTVGYGTHLNAGIPEAQSPVAALAPNIRLEPPNAEHPDVALVFNGNGEAVDMSGWRLAQAVVFTMPPGTVCDANDVLCIVADRRAYIAAHDAELTDQVIVGNAKFNSSTSSIALLDAEGGEVAKYAEPSDVSNFLRFFAWDGVPAQDDDGAGEWIVLTNISDTVTLDLAGVNVKVGKDTVAPKCDITLESGSLAPGGTVKLSYSDYASKGWEKITNGNLYLQLADANGTIGHSGGPVAQKDFDGYVNGLLYLQVTAFGAVFGQGDVIAASSMEVSPGEDVLFEAASQEEADAAVAGSTLVLSAEDADAGLAQYLKVVAEPVAGEAGKYKAVVIVDPSKVDAPELAAEGGQPPFAVAAKEGEGGGKSVEVSATISNAIPGLWYGYEVSDCLGAGMLFSNDTGSFGKATGATTTVTATPRTKPAGFFRIKILPARPTE